MNLIYTENPSLKCFTSEQEYQAYLNTVKEKRERLLYDEARISDEITDSYLDMFARPRVLAYREMKEKGINVKLLELKVDNDMDAINVSDTGDENNEQNNKPVEVTEDTNVKELK